MPIRLRPLPIVSETFLIPVWKESDEPLLFHILRDRLAAGTYDHLTPVKPDFVTAPQAGLCLGRDNSSTVSSKGGVPHGLIGATGLLGSSLRPTGWEGIS